MAARLSHRGPDDAGCHSDPDGRVSIGARRLSIIDVDRGHQPLSNEAGDVWAVHNGEIYNAPRLIERLTAIGHTFRSHCDTEVLVHLYEELGQDLVHALEGMYAFAIWDQQRGKLLLARDRFGEKPLFYWEGDGEIAFASELGALRQSIPASPVRAQSVDNFLVFGYVPGPETMFENVFQLEPGHVLEWDVSTRRCVSTEYWRPPNVEASSGESLQDLRAETIRLLRRAVSQTLVSDVPVGVFLSGGVDSTLIAALVGEMGTTPLTTFTVGYDVGDISETGFARRTALQLGSAHHELRLTADAVRDTVPDLLAALDQPLADQALVPLHAISRHARGAVKVAIGGQGADELFGGYPRYRWLHRSQRLAEGMLVAPRRWTARRLATEYLSWGRRQQVAALISPESTLERHVQWATKGRIHSRGDLYGERLADFRAGAGALDTCRRYLAGTGRPEADQLMHLDQRHWLPDDVLMMADRAGMLVGLEIRTPFLNRELAEFATTVQTQRHLGWSGKQLIRGALAELVPLRGVPRRKVAFRAPGASWLRGPLREAIEHAIHDGPLVTGGWIDPRAAQVWLRLNNGPAPQDFANFLWPLLALSAWFEGQNAA